jgi:hypothetical protein
MIFKQLEVVAYNLLLHDKTLAFFSSTGEIKAVSANFKSAMGISFSSNDAELNNTQEIQPVNDNNLFLRQIFFQSVGDQTLHI